MEGRFPNPLYKRVDKPGVTVCEFCGADLAPSAGAADATPMAPPSPSETSPISLTLPIPDKKE